MATCSCGEETLDTSGFAFAAHRLHGARACGRHHTFGEIVRAVADGSHEKDAVAHTLGDVDGALVGEALARLRDAGVLRFTHVVGGDSRAELAEDVASVADAERKLAEGGTLLAGDYAA